MSTAVSSNEGACISTIWAPFNFELLFDDGKAALDNYINIGALGLKALAAITQDGTLNVTMIALEAQLTSEEYEAPSGILPSLGHIGEGHYVETELNS